MMPILPRHPTIWCRRLKLAIGCSSFSTLARVCDVRLGARCKAPGKGARLRARDLGPPKSPIACDPWQGPLSHLHGRGAHSKVLPLRPPVPEFWVGCVGSFGIDTLAQFGIPYHGCQWVAHCSRQDTAQSAALCPVV